MPPPTARLRILQLFLLLLVAEALHACGNDPSQIVESEPIEVNHVWQRRRGSGTAQPAWRDIQIETVYNKDTIKAGSELNDRDVKDINKFVIYATKKFKQYLKVPAVNSQLDIINAGCFLNQSLGDNDFLLSITAEDCGSSTTLATCRSCHQEKVYVRKSDLKVFLKDDTSMSTDIDGNPDPAIYDTRLWGRPVAGLLTICLKSFKSRKLRIDDNGWKSTILHEIGHALAFGSHLYKNFHNGNLYHRDQLGFVPPSTTGCKAEDCLFEIPGVVKKVQRSWKHKTGTANRDVFMLVTPKATNAARKHFNCPDLEGVELENQGRPGSTFAHIEKRIYEHDTMTSTRTAYNSWSKITLAIMADSGWYQVDETKADPMSYGKGLGCDFARKSCKEYVDLKTPKNSYPFCSAKDQERCSENHESIEKCNIYTREEEKAPAMYTYFPMPGTEAALAAADYCPYYTTISSDKGDTKCNVPNMNVDEEPPKKGDDKDANNRRAKKGRLEIFSKTARCFEVGGEKKIDLGKGAHSTMNGFQHGCYEHKCDKGSLWIKTAKSKFYQCYYDGQKIHVSKRLIDEKATARFTITCPKCSKLCPSPFVCKDQKSSAPERVGDPDRSLKSSDGSTSTTAATVLSLFLLTIL